MKPIPLLDLDRSKGQAYICLLAMFGFASPLRGESPRQAPGPLRIAARVIEAIEDGPMVVEVRFTYVGKDDLEIKSFRRAEHADISIPCSWRFKTERVVGGNVSRTRSKLLTNQSWTETYYLHHEFSNIKAGDQKWRFAWKVHDRKTDKVIAETVQLLSFTIQQKSTTSLAAIRNRVREDLRKEPLSDTQFRELIERVSGAPHRELLFTMLEIMEHPKIADWLVERAAASFSFIPSYANYPTKEDIASVILEYLNRKTPRQAPAIVRVLQDNYRDVEKLPNHVSESLRKVPHPLVRGMCFLYFPREYRENDWQALRRQLTSIILPPNVDLTKSLIDKLDSDFFRVRQNATQELTEMGEAVMPALRRALRQAITIEQEERIVRIMTAIGNQPPPRLFETTLDALRREDSETATKILVALSENMPESWLATRAKAEIQRRKKNP